MVEDAEAAVLGAVLLSDVAIPALVVDEQLTPEAFASPVRAAAWRAMLELHGEGIRVDAVTLRSRLEAAGYGDGVAETIAAFELGVPNAGNVRAYGRQVVEEAQWRRIEGVTLEMHAAVEARDTAHLQRAEAMLMKAPRSTSDTVTPEALRDLLWKGLEGETEPAIPTPYRAINEGLEGGLKAAQISAIGGWTSHGKSIVIDEILEHAAAEGRKVHLYMTEMSAAERGRRGLSRRSDVPVGRISRPEQLSGLDYQAVVDALQSPTPFGITQVVDWTAEEIARDIRFQRWDVCALDLLHGLAAEDEKDLRRISQTLNAAAKASGTHLLVGLHMNELRSTGAIPPRPVLRDVRGSGMIKNDVDNVLFIYREDHEGDDGNVVQGEDAALYITKARAGQTGRESQLLFEGPKVRFYEVPMRDTPHRDGWGQ